MVLEVFSEPPFETRNQLDFKVLSLKTALLLALASGQHINDSHILLVTTLCIQFIGGEAQILLKPNSSFIPKAIKIQLHYWLFIIIPLFLKDLKD